MREESETESVLGADEVRSGCSLVVSAVVGVRFVEYGLKAVCVSVLAILPEVFISLDVLVGYASAVHSVK